MNRNVYIDFKSIEIAQEVMDDLIHMMRETDSNAISRGFMAQMIGEVSMWIAWNTPYTDPFDDAVEFVRKVVKS
jgi:hypothetical protein